MRDVSRPMNAAVKRNTAGKLAEAARLRLGREPARPLYVDLDGTLVATDTLWESVLQLARRKPWYLLHIPLWLARGPAHLKRQIASHTRLNPAALPYRQSVIEYIQHIKTQGRSVFLATAADRSIALSVADHLQVFDDVIASDGRNNLKSQQKLKLIQQHSQGAKFDYIGDCRADLPIWQAAERALVVNPSASLARRIEVVCPIRQSFVERQGGITDFFRAMRVHQWVKNALLFLPLILSHKVADPTSLVKAALAFVSFSFCASCAYLVNDLLDLESDRQHAQKRHRPFASGRLDILTGCLLASTALLAGLALGTYFLPPLFSVMLLGYVASTVAYSLYLKQKLAVDVLMLGGFYAYRVLIGAVAIGVVVSPWLCAFSMFFFLSLAFVKRYADLAAIQEGETSKLAGRGYYVEDLDMIRVVGPTSGYISVLVLALYINSGDVASLYPRPQWLWLICLCLLYWLTRVWFLAHRGQMPHDPVLFAIRDRISYAVGLTALALISIAAI